MLYYENIKVQVANDSTAYLSTDWQMNVGKGYIYQETWSKKKGKWVLTFDGFNINEMFKEKTTNNQFSSFESHNILLEVIDASKKWVDNFNNKNYVAISEGYTKDALMFTNPLGLKNGQEEIQGFWKYLVDNHVGNLIYDQPIFEEKNKNVLVTSEWSMNKYHGKIILEHWSNQNGNWLLTHDLFWINE